jgi:hypothetical protein
MGAKGVESVRWRGALWEVLLVLAGLVVLGLLISLSVSLKGRP